MEYVVVGLLVLVLILLVILIMRKKDDSQMIERLGRFETDITKEVGSFKLDFSKDLRNDFEKLNEKIENKLNLIKHQKTTFN